MYRTPAQALPLSGLGISTAELYARRYGIPLRPLSSVRPRPPGLHGLADATPQQISAIAATGAQTTVGLLVSLGAVTGPIGAAIGGAIAIGSMLVGVFKGCGQTCVEATSIVNQVEPILSQNVQNYLNSPVRTKSMQAAALNNFDTGWAAVVANCNNPALLKAGQNCIKDREQGSCAYHVSAGGWQGTKWVPYGSNGSGSTCWNWFVGYRDPIANDPNVVPDSAVTESTPGASTSAGAGTPAGSVTGSSVFGIPLGLAAAAGLLILALTMGD
jgi:hypothetical protein